ncbi:glycosyltransferase family 2 protein [Haloarcula sp. JP-L23]|uniref:glycosyltransferase family 2 protein n=1 Tax=Haloarcula sp. JP-L23 TaxID=2716717 RepID=UPI00140F3FC6|nr:glycosyltransferase [Haloarcula sp. JP-L23]
MSSPIVSIVVTAHNYAEYLETCLDSALDQTYDDYEVVVVDDGSTDETPDIVRAYHHEHPDTIVPLHLDGVGLPAACNAGIEAANGTYIVRLDADDYFDENILTVLTAFLDSHPETALVYPDYYTVDAEGTILDHVRLPEVGEEVKLLNRSPLAAGALYRKSAWERLGGYDESLSYQEDYDFWIRFADEFDVHNVNLPLMYYRQHTSNMSMNLTGRMSARRGVKRSFAESNFGVADNQEILAVVPARTEQRVNPPEGTPDHDDPLALWKVDGEPLLAYTISEALATPQVDRVVVSTDNEAIAGVAKDLGASVPRLRPSELSDPTAELSDVTMALLEELKTTESYVPDLLVQLPYVSPLRTADHITEAIDTYNIFSVDSVISVCENRKFQWQPGEYGLEPLFERRLLREEREALYQENGSIYVTGATTLRQHKDLIGSRVGHVLQSQVASLHIDSWFDWVVSKRLLEDHDELTPAFAHRGNDD